MSAMSPLKSILQTMFPNLSSLPLRLRGMGPFICDLSAYRSLARRENLAMPLLRDLFPRLEDRYQASGDVAQHYFLMDLWAARRIMAVAPAVHYDVGSRIDGFVAHLSLFCPVHVIDIRPQCLEIENVDFLKGDLTQLPFDDQQLTSLSCLHAAEHVGLGRYGDEIDPLGTRKACKELQRVLKAGGDLYFAVPVGRERTCFNAHRVHYPETILAYFEQLQLISFSLIDDSEQMIADVRPEDARRLEYGCGLFHFRR